jgi:quinol monooxygenase YgiN
VRPGGGHERLPAPQRDAVATAFGLRAGEAPDRFLVSLAVPSLLGEAAEEQPLIGPVNDAQWLDRASAQVLVFAARRLVAESVGLVFGSRQPGQDGDLTGLPELVVEGVGARKLPHAALVVARYLPGYVPRTGRNREGGAMDTPYAFVARIEAKPERAEDLAALLTGALPLAQAEPGTVDWYAARTSPTTFWIFDTFGSEDARQAHINGEIAAALMANADELLAAPPEILPADVLAAK